MRHSALLLFFLPYAANAEVMNKEFSVALVLFVALGGLLAAFYVARFLPWLLIVLIPIVSLFWVAHLSEVTDKYVGPAIAQETGYFYIVVSWCSPLLFFIGASVGLAIRTRRSRVLARNEVL